MGACRQSYSYAVPSATAPRAATLDPNALAQQLISLLVPQIVVKVGATISSDPAVVTTAQCMCSTPITVHSPGLISRLSVQELLAREPEQGLVEHYGASLAYGSDFRSLDRDHTEHVTQDPAPQDTDSAGLEVGTSCCYVTP